MTLNPRLTAKLTPIEELAHVCGWETDRQAMTVEGLEAVQLTGTTTRRDPDTLRAVDFGFGVAFAIGTTGRVQALRLDGKPKAVFVVVVDDGTNRYWHGPLNSYKQALNDPEDWTGVHVLSPEMSA